MVQNKYVEYRKWIVFWGLFLDSQKEIQQMINDYNKQGWRVVQFQYTRPNLSIGRSLLVLLIMVVTLGFVNYWVGVSVIFERGNTGSEGDSTTKRVSTRSDFDSVDVLNVPDKVESVNEFDTDIETLSIIIKKTKNALFSKFNPEVKESLEEICTNKDSALKLISDFDRQTGDDLLKLLTNLSSNYDSIKSYLSVFIKFEIVEEKYPHKLKA